MKLSSVEASGQKVKKFDPNMQKQSKESETTETLLEEIRDTLKLILEEMRKL